MSPGPTFPAAVLALPSPGRARGVRAACRPPLGARPSCDAPARPRRFATQERNALLLYNGRFNEKHDFIALEVVGEQVQLTFSAGRARPLPPASLRGALPRLPVPRPDPSWAGIGKARRCPLRCYL